MTIILRPRPMTVVPVLLLLTLALFSIYRVTPAEASTIPTNLIMNPSFENGASAQGVPLYWSFETCEGVANATVNLDSTTYSDPNYSAQVYSGPVTPTGCFGPIPGRQVGFTQFRPSLASSANFTDLTDSPDGFSFWFKLQPYNNSSGMGGFGIRVFGAESLAELDYAIDPDPALGTFVNNTGVHSLLFYGYQPGQWYHFSRNLRADWLNFGLSLRYPFSLVQFQGYVAQSGTAVKSETFWLDDVRAYVGNLLPHVMISQGSVATVDVPITFSAVVSGGTSPYSYQWSADGQKVSGATQSSYTTSFSTPGTHSVSINVTDLNQSMAMNSLSFNVQSLTITVNCPSNGTAGNPVTCNASAVGGAPPFTFTWSAPGGSPATGTGSSFTTTYVVKGTFVVNATATNGNGAKKSQTASIVVAPQPIVVTVSCGSATAAKPVTCNASASGGTPPFTFTWSAPGGSPSTGSGSNFTTAYANAGIDVVTATGTDANSANNSATANIVVSAQAPTVTISSVAPSPANTGDTVMIRFVVNTTAAITGITVDWGDGTITHPSSTATFDTHIYPSTGSLLSQEFTITVTATNSGGRGFATIHEIVNDRGPTVAITALSPSPANTGQLVELSITASDPDGTISAIYVDWGDGSKVDLILTLSSASRCSATDCVLPVNHVYATTGNSPVETFIVHVNATDNSGSVSFQTVSETIRDQSPVVIVTAVSPNPAYTDMVVTVTFSARDGDGSVSTVSVNWGDGSARNDLPSTAVSATHRYTSAGSFTISIKATDNGGSTSLVAASTVTVNIPIQSPTILGISPELFYYGVGGITAIIVIFGALTILQRRRKAVARSGPV